MEDDKVLVYGQQGTARLCEPYLDENGSGARFDSSIREFLRFDIQWRSLKRYSPYTHLALTEKKDSLIFA